MATFWWVLGTLFFCVIATNGIFNENKKIKKELEIEKEKNRTLEKLVSDKKSCTDFLKNNFINDEVKVALERYLKSLPENSIDEVEELIWDIRYPTGSNFISSDIAASDDYPTDREGDLDEFRKNLSIIWAGESFFVQFSYRDIYDNRSRRDVQLEEVSINSSGDAYFYGFCLDAQDYRLFKIKRITSKILFNKNKYGKSEFFKEILQLDYKDFS
ncbi:WYL domain-containing protein [Pectobacterium carotovorum]|uniref:WYL domain-containing protein n=1 Tax=Pectobacterium carotovorum TaxID=554 RepID=UPI00057E5B0C|nr:WYL domain-containing protein [Pectobacterium carotovorum]KHT35058.1 hypothetical protein RC99_10570 [Pectobacterium carotovorum subsp. carotovorum]